MTYLKAISDHTGARQDKARLRRAGKADGATRRAGFESAGQRSNETCRETVSHHVIEGRASDYACPVFADGERLQ